jgi:ribonuclease BN (tRNA processing enzyme)
VLIFDAQYTEEEYQSKRGWGHSTWLEATRVAKDAGVKQLVLFHHDPLHGDETMHGIVNRARRHFESTDAAREGTTIATESFRPAVERDRTPTSLRSPE